MCDILDDRSASYITRERLNRSGTEFTEIKKLYPMDMGTITGDTTAIILMVMPNTKSYCLKCCL